jgi:hypothetical protein
MRVAARVWMKQRSPGAAIPPSAPPDRFEYYLGGMHDRQQPPATQGETVNVSFPPALRDGYPKSRRITRRMAITR